MGKIPLQPLTCLIPLCSCNKLLLPLLPAETIASACKYFSGKNLTYNTKTLVGVHVFKLENLIGKIISQFDTNNSLSHQEYIRDKSVQPPIPLWYIPSFSKMMQ